MAAGQTDSYTETQSSQPPRFLLCTQGASCYSRLSHTWHPRLESGPKAVCPWQSRAPGPATLLPYTPQLHAPSTSLQPPSPRHHRDQPQVSVLCFVTCFLGALLLIHSSIPILNLLKYFLSQELYNLLPSPPQFWAQSWLKHSVPQKLFLKAQAWGFPGGSEVKNPPAHVGDTGLIPGQGTSHLLRSNYEAQLLSPRSVEPESSNY